MIQKPTSRGHLFALLSIFIWGTTFISTKVLLRTLQPIEILFIRIFIGFVFLILFYPRRLKLTDRRQERLFAAAGLMGITVYYLCENIALTYTAASNVSIIVTIAPFFTALLSVPFLKAEKPRLPFYLGFAAAISGVILISYSGSSSLELNPLGDLLAAAAAISWAFYSILTRKISELGYNTIQATRRVFLYGLLFMIPMLFVLGFHLEIEKITSVVNLGNLLYLGLCASALCFVTWGSAVKLLGAVKTSVYIYLVPVVTLVASVLILHEPLTPALIIGSLLTLLGLWLSQTKMFIK